MRKIFIPLAVSAIALTLIIMSSGAVMDISARGRVSSPLSSSLAHYTMGIIYDNEEKFTDAIREYREALSLEPEISYVHTRLAVDYILTNKDKEALDELRIAGSLDPNDVKPKTLLANIYLAMGYADSELKKYDEALKFYNKALELDKNEPAIYFYLGALYDELNNKNAAIKNLREAIKLDVNFSDAYNYLGYMFAESGENLDEAVTLIRKALEIDPDNGAYMDSLGWAYFKKGMYKEALVDLEKANKCYPDDPDIKEHLRAIREKLRK